MARARDLGAAAVIELVRRQGQRRLAERAHRAALLAVERGWSGAWSELLEGALLRSAGRHAESSAVRGALATRITAHLGTPLERRLAEWAGDRPALVEALRGAGALGPQRAAELGWNAALPLLIALAAAYDDVALARATSRLAAEWPAARPYGRTRALDELLQGPIAGPPQHAERPPRTPAGREGAGEEPRPSRDALPRGALWAQGLLHLQDVWCTRGGCGACPLSTPEGSTA